MEDFICVLMTSHGCGHCSHFRGNGIIENGKNFMKHTYLEKITKHCTFLNIHYKNMSGQTMLIDSISKFTKVGNKNILQEYYNTKEGKSHVDVVMSVNGKTKHVSSDPITIGTESVSWVNFLNKKIPIKLVNYAYFYPCFVFISKKNWKQGLEGKEFYGLTNAGLTKKMPNGTIGLEKTSQSINSRNVQVEVLLNDLVSKKINLDLYLEGEEEKEEKEETLTFLLKGFEEE